MWLKLTEIKFKTGETKTILLNADSISHMMKADKNNDSYIKMKVSEAGETFFFVKESLDQIYAMLNPVPSMLPMLASRNMNGDLIPYGVR